ncbi:MAG: transcriptional regulator [Bdellovibrionales bacterium RIFCSPHIGHO2_01_FULL_40_29]|nr:MAG: transcriptional regulator [Bdellovibrionales bacterium RIFCSPHIGHO2_01_FULL_40_29]OFZ34864.1 MAG: transcriptional regulator [Bdellovibrionales bacterium RIFCSPHIGHO2_02_FULL_40_15]
MKVPVPKKTRNLEKSRKEILDAAFIQIFTKGFQGTSIDDIVGKTQFTKGTFYHQFPTKLDLGYALVDEVIAPMIIDRWIVPLEKFENPLEGILFQLKTLIGESDPKHLKLGCPLNNLVQEMSPIDKEFHKKLKQALNLWIDELEKHLLRGQKSGFIQKSINTRQIAQFIVMAHEGFYGLIKGLDDPDIFKSLYIQLQSYFKTIEV